MNYLEKLVGDIETHDVEGIRECFENGIDPNDMYNGEPLIYELTSEYLRSANFRRCVQVFVDFGLKFSNRALLAVLLDDAATLNNLIQQDTTIISRTISLRSAFTPLYHASLLHVCAEFNHMDCARVLVEHGADLNVNAGVDEHGFGGQTPIFHTVNQILNNSIDMLHFLLSKNADLMITVAGLVWGKGYPWETFIPSVNPISYTMMGLLPQFHRKEKTISEIVTLLMRHAYGIGYTPQNIPNAYLK
jgi:hypothetical protein